MVTETGPERIRIDIERLVRQELATVAPAKTRNLTTRRNRKLSGKIQLHAAKELVSILVDAVLTVICAGCRIIGRRIFVKILVEAKVKMKARFNISFSIFFSI